MQVPDHHFQHTPPTSDEIAVMHATVRQIIHKTADEMLSFLPDCRETSIMITKLEEAMFWSNAALARHGEDAGGFQ